MVVGLGQADSDDTYMSPTASTSNRIRCFTTWVESTMLEDQHRGPLVSRRRNLSYQLPGITGCLSSPKNLCKQRTTEWPNSPQNGQHLSSNIYKLEGRQTFSPTVQSSSKDLEVVSPEATNDSSRTFLKQP